MTVYEQIQAAIETVERDLSVSHSQAGVAARIGMSARSFQDYFWRVTGLTFREYLSRRRLCTALVALGHMDLSILEVALEVGYGTHESFSRAFRREFSLSPQEYRKAGISVSGLEKIQLFREHYMGVIVKELPEMIAVAFDGFSPDPEGEAGAKLSAWGLLHPASGAKRRVFGHNIDRGGNLYTNPQNVGYRFLACIDDEGEADGQRTTVIPAGRFVVTGIEGRMSPETGGAWITEGWNRMHEMVARRGYRIRHPVRWYEEELEPRTADCLRLDLYLEIE